MNVRLLTAWKAVTYVPRLTMLFGLSVAFGREDLVPLPRTLMTTEEFERLRDKEAQKP